MGAALALGLATLSTGVEGSTQISDVALAGSQGNPGAAPFVAPHAAGARLLVSLVLAPRGGGQIERFLAQLQNPKSPRYHQWLKTGEFNRRFAPASADAGAARAFLARAGLRIEASPSPFLVRASGTTAQVQAAFSTTIDDYRAASGVSFFANAQAAHIPAALVTKVVGVTGLTNTVRLHPSYTPGPRTGGITPAYGKGPGGSGLTPGQLEGIYGAAAIHQAANGRGQGTTLAVFELSGYTYADIAHYEAQFFGGALPIAVTDVNVDGGPVTPACPSGDICGPFDSGSCANGCNSADYSGDGEVESDIEVQIAMAPAADAILVYNAPNDGTGTTGLDETFQIANDNTADVVSSSWGLCEPDATVGQALAEYPAFAQMAAQGQSMFAATGDHGAYDCLGDPSHQKVNVDDPPSQPYLTAVGGTSMGTFDPGSNTHPTYPQGKESVWNPDNQCHGTKNGPNGSDCSGAGGGGVSRFWPRPSYQKGNGVSSTYTRTGPYCSGAADGQRCREIPDVSAVADPNTGYAIYCTGDSTTTGAGAASCVAADDVVSGWGAIGGTSLSTPLWSAIIDLSVSYHGARFGQANPVLYQWFRAPGAYTTDFHDITGKHVAAKTNGYYPSTSNFDMATGIGTPIASAIVMATP